MTPGLAHLLAQVRSTERSSDTAVATFAWAIAGFVAFVCLLVFV